MVAHRFAGNGLRVAVFEKESAPAKGVTSGQASVIHVVQLPFRSLKSRLAREGNKMYDELCATLGVRMMRVPILLVVRSIAPLPILPFVYVYLRTRLGRDFPVQLKRGSALRKIEPELSARVSGGIVVHGYAVIDWQALATKLYEASAAKGTKFWFNCEVRSGSVAAGGVVLETSLGSFRCDYVVNAAGLYSDEVARRFGSDLGKHEPGLGAMAVLDGPPMNSIVAPLPIRSQKRTKGGAIIPLVGGGTLIGPTLRSNDGKEDRSTTEEDQRILLEKFSPLLRRVGRPVRLFAGVRPLSPTRDFIVEYSEKGRTIHLVGIESPGLTAAPAIAKLVAEKLEAAGLHARAVASSRPVGTRVAGGQATDGGL